MYLDVNGALVLSLAVGDQTAEKYIGTELNDGQWHTVILRVGDEHDNVTVSVTHDGDSSSETIDHNDLGVDVHSIDLHSNNPQLRVGAGLVGCIREGPGVRFTKPSVAVNSVAVAWGRCLLPESCSGRTNSYLTFIQSQCDQITASEVAQFFPKSCSKAFPEVLTVKLMLCKITHNVTKYLGNFCSKFIRTRTLKMAQSGHTVSVHCGFCNRLV